MTSLLRTSRSVRGVFKVRSSRRASRRDPVHSISVGASRSKVPGLSISVSDPLSVSRVVSGNVSVLLPRFGVLQSRARFFARLCG